VKDTAPDAHFATQWFENRLNEVKAQLETMYQQFRLSEALKTVYSLIWDDFCSWYLEWTKPGFEQPVDAAIYQKTLAFFSDLMELLHPFMPFITEEIYHLLQERPRGDDLCVRQAKPAAQVDNTLSAQGELLKNVITAIRDARNKNQIKPKDAITLSIQTSDRKLYTGIRQILGRQVNADAVTFVSEPVTNSIAVVAGKDKFYIETEKTLDPAAQKEQLQKELDYQKGFLLSVEKKLGNERFVQNAKPEVVEGERRKKADAEAKIKVLQESLAGLE